MMKRKGGRQPQEPLVLNLTELPDDEPQKYTKVGMTPNIFDLEEALKILQGVDRINVRLTRIQLKWLMKACEKHIGVQFRHPYKGGDVKESVVPW
jgi:hypothetical protein